MKKVHIAGFPVRIGLKRRQRCAWCDVVLIDVDLALVAVPDGQSPEPHFWETGSLVELVTGHGFSAQTVVPHTDGDALPVSACGHPPVKLEVVR